MSDDEKTIETSSGAKITYEKLPITGYRSLTETEVKLMNLAKGQASVTGDFIAQLELMPEIDKRWLAIAKTDLQKAFMALVRAITKLDTF